jgi:hypothetical protein
MTAAAMWRFPLTCSCFGNNANADPWMNMHEHVFADENKAKGFVLVAVAVMPVDLAALRAQVNGFRLRGQRRLHFSHESDRRRKAIIGSLASADIQARVYDAAQYRDEKFARDLAIAQLADDAAAIGAARLVLEVDDSVVRNDRLIIRNRLLKAGCADSVRYEHRRAAEECLLALPDAIAWCWVKGSIWRKRAEPLIRDVVVL